MRKSRSVFACLVVATAVLTVVACSDAGAQVDVVPEVTGLTVDVSGRSLTARWTDPAGSDIDAILVNWIPAVAEPQPIEVEPGLEEATIHGLVAGIDYVLVVRSRSANGALSTGATATAAVPDVFPLTDVTPPGAAEYRFGDAIAVSEDYVAIGSPSSDSGSMSFVGRVHLLERAADGTLSEAVVLSPDAEVEGEYFGDSLAFADEQLLVGASGSSYDDVPGALYVFQRSGDGTWAQLQRLTGSGGGGADGFGTSIAVQGDEAYVGATRENSVYLYERDGSGTWAHSPDTLSVVDTRAFGQSIALNSATLVIGAPADDYGTGAVFVYERDPGGQWTGPERLTSPVSDDGYGSFGTTIAMDDRFFYIGAPNAEARSTDEAGFVYVYRREADGSWRSYERIHAPVPAEGARFGSAIALTRDLVFVGAEEDEAPNESESSAIGTVYAFDRAEAVTDTLYPVQVLFPEEEEVGWFGSALATGNALLVIGAKGSPYVGREGSGTFAVTVD